MPAAGALWAVALVSAAATGARGHVAATFGVLGTFASLLALLIIRSGPAVLHARVARRTGTNLVATRGAGPPSVWLVAHLDSKSQPVPMIVRVVGVGGSLVVQGAAMLLAIAAAFGADVARLWWPLAALGVVLVLPVVASVVRDRAPGALDNASGVVAVLLATTEPLRDAPPLPPSCGVLLTSAEELALAGARAWVDDLRTARAADRSAPAGPADRLVALNVDGVDDDGPLRVMVASPLPGTVEDALARDGTVRRSSVPPGVLVDAIAFAERRLAALTVSRGRLRTLGRIHTPNDSLARLRGDGIPDAARLLRRLAAAASA